MRPRDRLAMAAHELLPLKQGQLDGLCGLYSIINAVRLALYPDRRLRQRHVQRLFAAGLARMEAGRGATNVVHNGVSEQLWLTLCDHVVAEANIMLDVELRRMRLVTASDRPETRQFIRSIRRALRHGRPVLFIVSNGQNHATVATGYSEMRLELFDSAGACWFETRSLGLDDRRTTKRHRLSAWSASCLVDLARFGELPG